VEQPTSHLRNRHIPKWRFSAGMSVNRPVKANFSTTTRPAPRRRVRPSAPIPPRANVPTNAESSPRHRTRIRLPGDPPRWIGSVRAAARSISSESYADRPSSDHYAV